MIGMRIIVARQKRLEDNLRRSEAEYHTLALNDALCAA
jgi:hypothetical protein